MDIEILYHDKFKFEQEEFLFKMYLNRITKISNNLITVDLLWPDFIQIILELFQVDIELHEQNFQA